jgi:hypothetical protein
MAPPLPLGGILMTVPYSVSTIFGFRLVERVNCFHVVWEDAATSVFVKVPCNDRFSCTLIISLKKNSTVESGYHFVMLDDKFGHLAVHLARDPDIV